MGKKEKSHSTISNIWFLIKLAFGYAPWFIALEISHGIFMGVFTSADVIFVKLFYEALEKNLPFEHVLAIILLIIAVTFLYQLWFQFYRNVIRPWNHQTLQTRLNLYLFEHARRMDLECYEKNEFYDNFVWATRQSDSQISNLLRMISNMITMLIAVVITTSTMASVSVMMTIFAVATSILTIFLQRKRVKNTYECNVEINKVDRKLGYYERVFYTPDYAKELRLSNISKVLIGKYNKELTEKRDVAAKHNVKGLKYALPLNLSSILMQPIVYMVLLYQSMGEGFKAISEIAITYSIFWNLRGRMQALMELSVRIAEIALYTDVIRTFLETNPKVNIGSVPINNIDRIDFNHVHFGYEADKDVLHDICVSVKKGEKIALVGYNGSGKTTFVKLLVNLYRPNFGTILYNGYDVSEYSKESLIEKTGLVFQDYKLYALSIAENVYCDLVENIDEGCVAFALNEVNFKLDDFAFKSGIFTELTKEFTSDGIILSGGESQKVAISRVFAHDYDLIILDEPSASLDPITEYNLYRHIEKKTDGKTIIYISHRLSTTRNADRIYMFKNGRIIETGNHSELMEMNGEYAYMYRIQAEKFNGGQIVT